VTTTDHVKTFTSSANLLKQIMQSLENAISRLFKKWRWYHSQSTFDQSNLNFNWFFYCRVPAKKWKYHCG